MKVHQELKDEIGCKLKHVAISVAAGDAEELAHVNTFDVVPLHTALKATRRKGQNASDALEPMTAVHGDIEGSTLNFICHITAIPRLDQPLATVEGMPDFVFGASGDKK